MKTVDALGGMLTAPVATLRRIAAEGANPVAPIALLLVSIVFIEAKTLQRLAFLVVDGGTVILKRFPDVFVDDLRTDAALLVGTCAVVAVLARVLTQGAVSPLRAAQAAAYLTVPLVVLMCIGGFLDGLGLPLWWLPHLAVDSMAVVVGREVSTVRFLVKCAVAYAIPLGLALTLVLGWRKQTAPSSTTRLRAGGAALALAFVLLLVGAGVTTAKYSERIRPTLPGDKLPDVTLHRLDEFGPSSDKVKLSMFEGKVLVVDFWASWCAPCRRSMPELSKIYADHKDEGLMVLGIDREPENPKAARKALAEIKPAFDCAIDDRGYGERMGLTTLPTSYIVDKHGVVRHMHLGYTDSDVVEGEIKALLAEAN
ncbi:MAG TPA: redoxin domain-containing protein [Myxococcota bacterium]